MARLRGRPRLRLRGRQARARGQPGARHASSALAHRQRASPRRPGSRCGSSTSAATPTERILLAGRRRRGLLARPRATPCAGSSSATTRAARWPTASTRSRTPTTCFPLLAVAVLFALAPARDVHDADAAARLARHHRRPRAARSAPAPRCCVRSELPARRDLGRALRRVAPRHRQRRRGSRSPRSPPASSSGSRCRRSRSTARELRAMVAPTERPVLLPALVLAGAQHRLPRDARRSRGSPPRPSPRASSAKVVIGWLLAASLAPRAQGGAARRPVAHVVGRARDEHRPGLRAALPRRGRRHGARRRRARRRPSASSSGPARLRRALQAGGRDRRGTPTQPSAAGATRHERRRDAPSIGASVAHATHALLLARGFGGLLFYVTRAVPEVARRVSGRSPPSASCCSPARS